ncbi:hypothetical protein ZWY2020_004852 [Hordeum vulgare]|nr:hypothetical protein ZWY2020_004852 [Hordeum vulgare]
MNHLRSESYFCFQSREPRTSHLPCGGDPVPAAVDPPSPLLLNSLLAASAAASHPAIALRLLALIREHNFLPDLASYSHLFASLLNTRDPPDAAILERLLGDLRDSSPTSSPRRPSGSRHAPMSSPRSSPRSASPVACPRLKRYSWNSSLPGKSNRGHASTTRCSKGMSKLGRKGGAAVACGELS